MRKLAARHVQEDFFTQFCGGACMSHAQTCLKREQEPRGQQQGE
jgi:hypothetical protein